jgi:hypothetical protein
MVFVAALAVVSPVARVQMDDGMVRVVLETERGEIEIARSTPGTHPPRPRISFATWIAGSTMAACFTVP